MIVQCDHTFELLRKPKFRIRAKRNVLRGKIAYMQTAISKHIFRRYILHIHPWGIEFHPGCNIVLDEIILQTSLSKLCSYAIARPLLLGVLLYRQTWLSVFVHGQTGGPHVRLPLILSRLLLLPLFVLFPRLLRPHILLRNSTVWFGAASTQYAPHTSPATTYCISR